MFDNQVESIDSTWSDNISRKNIRHDRRKKKQFNKEGQNKAKESTYLRLDVEGREFLLAVSLAVVARVDPDLDLCIETGIDFRGGVDAPRG